MPAHPGGLCRIRVKSFVCYPRMLIPNKPKRPGRESRLTSLAEISASLPDEALLTLFEFAEFLASKYPAENPVDQVYNPLPRPEDESVVAAIKRLSKSYPMLDKTTLFDQTSAAMSAHILQDVSKQESIDKLERVFKDKYEAFLNASEEA